MPRKDLVWLVASFFAIGLSTESKGESLPLGALNVIHWGVDNGLAPGPINTAIQTRDGYLWFGSDDGLARFDGVRARIFDSRNTPEFKSSRISALFEDASGTLWIGTKGGGIVRFQKGTFTSYTKEDGLENEQVTAICEDGVRTLWVGTDGGGLFRFADGRFARWEPEGTYNDSFIYALAADREGALFVGTGVGLQRVQGNKVQTFTSTNGLMAGEISALFCDQNGVMWIGGRNGLFLFENGLLQKFVLNEGIEYVEAICDDGAGSIWIGTAGGLYRHADSSITRYGINDGLSGKIAACLLADREGNLWVGNEANGVDQLRRTRFRVYSTRQGMSHEITTSIYQDPGGTLWIGSHNGLNQLRDGRIKQFTTRDGLSGDLILSVNGDHDGGIWLGTLSGLNLLKDGKVRIFTAEDGLPAKAVWSVYCARDGTIWAGTHKGLVKVENGRLKVFDYDNAGLSHNDVRAICEDGKGDLWVGTSYGLNRMRGGQFEKFITPTPDLALETIYTLHADDSGSLWIGTADRGLVRYRNGTFTQYNSKDGLYDDTVFQILEDNSHNLWLSCGRGVYKIAKEGFDSFDRGTITNLSPKVFGHADGLLSTECSGSIQPAGWKTSDGELWFPTSKGAAVINPVEEFKNAISPPVLIEKVLVEGRETQDSSNVVIAAGAEQIQIDYTALSFVVPKQVKFKYQLVGLEHDWVDAGERRVAYYPYLPPGEYQFKVIACNNDGVWNYEGATLGVTMEPFFWQTTLFKVGFGFCGIFSTGFVVWRFSRKKHRRQLAALEQQHALELERSRIARDMHDGVGASLVKISLLGELVENEMTGAQQKTEQVHKITVAARKAVRDMDEIVWAVNPKNDTLENLANYICQFTREHFSDTAVQCRMEIPLELPTWPLRADVRHNLFLTIQEALNNVLKHARASEVTVRMELAESVLCISVEDTGCGCASATNKGRVGNGLDNMRKRLADIGGKLEWRSEPERGTAVRMTVPLREQQKKIGI